MVAQRNGYATIRLPTREGPQCAAGLRGSGGQINQVPGPELYPMEWTSKGPESNLEGGATRGAGQLRAIGSRMELQKVGPQLSSRVQYGGWLVVRIERVSS